MQGYKYLVYIIVAKNSEYLPSALCRKIACDTEVKDMRLFYQIATVEILFLTGWLSGRKKIITEEANRCLSALLVNVVNPILIITSFQIKFSMEKLNELIATFILSAAAFAVMIVLSHLFIRKNGEDTALNRVAVVYPNCGFIGLPIVYSLFGNNGVFYLSIYVAMFNIYFWTHGVSSIQTQMKKIDLLRIVKSPAIIAIIIGIILFLLDIRIIEPFYSAMNSIAQINTPLALMVCGASITGVNLIETVKEKSVFKVTLLRLIMMPCAVALLLYFVPVSAIIKCVIVIASACPMAASCNIVAIQQCSNYKLTSKYFAVTTLLCIVTLSLIVLLITQIY